MWWLMWAALAAEPVVVAELYTSQGCSSCPPADRILGELATRDDVITLSFHVDYWDRLGWRDPTSSPQWASRQRAYAKAMGAGGVYTPQLVVNGRSELVGSRRSEVLQALQTSSEVPGLDLSVSRAARVVTLKDLPAGATVFLVERDRSNAVPRGENQGRTLSHVSVVRAQESAKEGSASLTLPADLSPAAASVVVVVHDPATRAIRAAGRAAVPDAT